MREIKVEEINTIKMTTISNEGGIYSIDYSRVSDNKFRGVYTDTNPGNGKEICARCGELHNIGENCTECSEDFVSIVLEKDLVEITNDILSDEDESVKVYINLERVK